MVYAFSATACPVSGVDGVDRSELRTLPVKLALKLGSADFAAAKRHGFENSLVPECRFLIGLFRRVPAHDCVLFVCIRVLFSHK